MIIVTLKLHECLLGHSMQNSQIFQGKTTKAKYVFLGFTHTEEQWIV